MCEFETELRTLFAQAGYAIADVQASQMVAYYDCMVRENKKYNLTSIVQPHDAAWKHFLDSVVPVDEIPQGARVIDVGSGGGFPAAPVKIMRPDVEMSALDATQKKCRFIQMAAQEAGIAIQAIHGRAEEQAQLREQFDVCISRAVADLPVLLELCAHFVKVGGKLLAYKANAEEERNRAESAAHALGLNYEKTIDFPLHEIEHGVLVYQKKKPTQQNFPRIYPQIVKKPL